MNDLVESAQTDRGWATNFDSAGNATNGLKMIDGATDAASAFSRGDWIEGTIHGVSAGLDVVGTIFNPLAGAVSMVVNWIIEHCGPIQDWLDQLLGDPAVIQASAQTWRNVGDHLQGVMDDFSSFVSKDLSGFQGLTVEAYESFAQSEAAVLGAVSQVSQGVAAGVELAGGLLGGVRAFIVELFSDLVGAAVDAVAKVVFTAGIATPAALGGLVWKAKEVLESCRKFMTAFSTSLDEMASLMGKMSPALESSTKLLSKIADDALSMPQQLSVAFTLNTARGATGGNSVGEA